MKLAIRVIALLVCYACSVSVGQAITIQIDYSLDANNFFNTQAKRDLLQSAADTLATQLTDNLTAIAPGGNNSWTEVFQDPSSGAVQNIDNRTIPANTVVVYAGGQDLASGILGVGGPGGFNVSGTQAFVDTVAARGQGNTSGATANDFGPWGGAVTFTTDASISWDFSAMPPTDSQYDFFSVAEHELSHSLGFGDSDSWTRLVSGSNTFLGASATAANGGVNPPLSPDHGHWASGTMSGGHLATMDPSIANGVRSPFTPLDFAGLKDVGWMLAAPGLAGDVNHDHIVNGLDISAVASHWLSLGPAGDANHDAVVNGLDISVIASNWLATGAGGSAAVPEPSSACIAIMAIAILGMVRVVTRCA